MAENSTQSFSSNLPKWLPTIVLIGSLLISWGGAVVKFASLENEVEFLRSKVEKADATLVTLQIDIREIKTNLEFIKNKIQ